MNRKLSLEYVFEVNHLLLLSFLGFILTLFIVSCAEEEVAVPVTKSEPPLQKTEPSLPKSPCMSQGTSPEVPKDLEVKGSLELSKCASFNRLVLTKDSRIITNGQDVEINAVELVSDNATIESFPKDSRTGTGRGGRSGGRIWLRALRASGQLSIQARGESGGHGETGYSGKNGAPGIPGNAGQCDVNPKLRPSREEREGVMAAVLGKIPNFNGYRWDTLYETGPLFICTYQTTDGGPGGDGTPGGDGGNGGSGGDSAQIFIETKDGAGLRTNIEIEEGKAGELGKGGPAGKGGPGGPPGQIDVGRRCREATIGSPGRDSINGKDGLPGQPGKKQPFCVKTGNSTYGECDKF